MWVKKESIEDEYPNFKDKFNSDIISVSEYEYYGYEFLLNY